MCLAALIDYTPEQARAVAHCEALLFAHYQRCEERAARYPSLIYSPATARPSRDARSHVPPASAVAGDLSLADAA